MKTNNWCDLETRIKTHTWTHVIMAHNGVAIFIALCWGEGRYVCIYKFPLLKKGW